MSRNLRFTSRLCAAALMGWVASSAFVSAQPPLPTSPVPVIGGEVPALNLNATVGDTTGMLTLPIRTVAALGGDASGSGIVAGRLTQGGVAVANRNVYLLDGANKVAAVARTNANGSFELSAPRAGDFTFLSGPLAPGGRRLVRIGDENSPVQAVLAQRDVARVLAEVGGAVEMPIGTVPAGNSRVIFANNEFTLNGVRRAGGNEYAVLESGTFRGIVTSLDSAGFRRSLPNAALYLIREGTIVQRVASASNGSFAFPTVAPGAYTLVATIGGSVATTNVAAPLGVAEVPLMPGASGLVSPYYAGAVGDMARSLNVRFPFESVAIQRILIREQPATAAPAGAAGAAGGSAEFRFDGGIDPNVLVSFSSATVAGQDDPVINMSPAPWGDLSPLFGTGQVDYGVGIAPTPILAPGGFAPGGFEGGFGGGGFGGGGGGFGGGGGGGFGGAGALAGLAAAAGIAAAASGRGGGGGNTIVASPLRP